jgi:hypothetical protein
MAGARRLSRAPTFVPPRRLAPFCSRRRAFITGLAALSAFAFVGTRARCDELDGQARRILSDIAEAHQDYKRRALAASGMPDDPNPDAKSWQATLEAHAGFHLAIPQIHRYGLLFDTAEPLKIADRPAGRLFYRKRLGGVATLTFIPHAAGLVPITDHRKPFRMKKTVLQVWNKQNVLLILSEDDDAGPSALLRAEINGQF